jgi:GNAT superfamily N-acetyltransferase
MEEFAISEWANRIDSPVPNILYVHAHHVSTIAPVGILRLEVDPNGNPGWISSIFIDEDMRRKGLAKALLERAFEAARRCELKTVGLSVSRTNYGARQLYDSLGFLPYLTGHDGFDQMIKVL